MVRIGKALDQAFRGGNGLFTGRLFFGNRW